MKTSTPASEHEDSNPLHDLISGYQAFKSQNYEERHDRPDASSKPESLIVSCCDCYLSPATITNAAPEDLYIIRNIANLIPPFQDPAAPYQETIAAVQFALTSSQIKHIIILGHRHCQGIEALLKQQPSARYVQDWLAIAEQARKEVMSEHAEMDFANQSLLCEQLALLISLKNLYTFPWVSDRTKSGDLTLHAWHFDSATGDIQRFHQEHAEFIPLDSQSN